MTPPPAIAATGRIKASRGVTETGSHAEHDPETRRKLRALIDDEGERPRDHEDAGDAEEPRLPAGVDPDRSDKEHEERGAEAERDTRI